MRQAYAPPSELQHAMRLQKEIARLQQAYAPPSDFLQLAEMSRIEADRREAAEQQATEREEAYRAVLRKNRKRPIGFMRAESD